MNQDAFRTLVVTPGASSSASRGSFLPITSSSRAKPSKSASGSAPATFKPRKVKKAVPDGYRDRAAERRVGDVNEYADVETLLENFERRVANAEDTEDMEAQRKYLGGDEKHTVLVKGLDFALLEQRKAQTGSKVDDDALEDAFMEAAAPSTLLPKKRAQDDLTDEPKTKRDRSSNNDTSASAEIAKEAKALEKAKQMGKFKPIGAPSAEAKAKDDKRKKKKRKLVAAALSAQKRAKDATTESNAVTVVEPILPTTIPKPNSNDPWISAKSASSTSRPVDTEPEPDEDIDIFADVGEYEGVDLGDDDSDDAKNQPKPAALTSDQDTRPKASNWFDDPESDSDPILPPPKVTTLRPPSPVDPSCRFPDDDGNQPVRLAPLATSSMRDIKEFLQLDKEMERAELRKARKEKNKGKRA